MIHSIVFSILSLLVTVYESLRSTSLPILQHGRLFSLSSHPRWHNPSIVHEMSARPDRSSDTMARIVIHFEYGVSFIGFRPGILPG
jgi:hypothetical protein